MFIQGSYVILDIDALYKVITPVNYQGLKSVAYKKL